MACAIRTPSAYRVTIQDIPSRQTLSFKQVHIDSSEVEIQLHSPSQSLHHVHLLVTDYPSLILLTYDGERFDIKCQLKIVDSPTNCRCSQLELSSNGMVALFSVSWQVAESIQTSPSKVTSCGSFVVVENAFNEYVSPIHYKWVPVN